MQKLSKVDPKKAKWIKDHFLLKKKVAEVIGNILGWGKIKSDIYKKLTPANKEYYKFYVEQGSLSSILYTSLEGMLKENFGRCDFKFKANREYRNYLIEHEGYSFIVAPNSFGEVVLPVSKNKEFYNAIISFHSHLLKLCIDWIEKNRKKVPEDVLTDVRDLKRIGTISKDNWFHSIEELFDFLGRYEFSQGNSHKFWEVQKDSHGDFKVSWGKIGKEGEFIYWDGDDPVSEHELKRKVKQKLKSGYKKVK